jgi:hypothetical protein
MSVGSTIELDRTHRVLSIRRQCQLLGVARSGRYRTPSPANDNVLALMRRIDELFMACPFLGSQRMAQILREGDGCAVGQRLMGPHEPIGEHVGTRIQSHTSCAACGSID